VKDEDMDEQKKGKPTDITPFMKGNKDYTKEFMVSGQPVTINAFFSARRAADYEQFIQRYGAREAFVKLAYSMYTNTAPVPENLLKESDFANASDEELTEILIFLIAQDEKAEEALATVEGEDVFAKFKVALDVSWQPMRESIAKAFTGLKVPAFAMDKTLLKTTALRFEVPDYLKQLRMPAYDFSALLPKFDYPLVRSVLTESSGVNTALSQFAAQINLATSALDELKGVNTALSQFASHINQLAPSYDLFKDNLSSIIGQISTIDFSLITLQERWSKKHDAFVAFGWFYLAEMPLSIINAIYKEHETIAPADVDACICAFFRKKQCEALKTIVKKWNNSPYFAPRRHVLHEALVNHSRKYFNSAVMMLTLQTEGIITDFVRIRLKTPRRETKKAIEDITTHLDNIRPMKSGWQKRECTTQS
jgi:hypothetical protein